MHLVLDTKRINLKVRKACFHLQTEKHERLISPQKISSISITTQCWMSSSAIRLAVQHKIPIYFHDALGNIEGRLWTASFGHLATNRRNQVLFKLNLKSTEWMIEIFEHKTDGQIQNLNYLKSRKVRFSDELEISISKLEIGKIDLQTFKNSYLDDCAASLMGREGTMARYYWQSIIKCMPDDMKFEDRNRRPAKDYFNAALNYLYGMLYGVVENAIFLVGLDPYLGMLHADEYNQPTLTFDMIEPFRPWIDRFLIEKILSNEIKPDFFQQKDGGFWLSKNGKQYLIPKFNEFLEDKIIFRDKLLTRKAHIYRLMLDLLKVLTNFDFKP
jgi:CRISPR-associated protein Cas1